MNKRRALGADIWCMYYCFRAYSRLTMLKPAPRSIDSSLNSPPYKNILLDAYQWETETHRAEGLAWTASAAWNAESLASHLRQSHAGPTLSPCWAMVGTVTRMSLV